MSLLVTLIRGSYSETEQRSLAMVHGRVVSSHWVVFCKLL